METDDIKYRMWRKFMRKQYIECLRVVAMMFVVAVHVAITALSDFSVQQVWEEVLFLAIRNLGHFAVPVFFMISGALMLSPKKEIPISKLVKKYILRYIGVIAIFGWGFAIIENVFVDKKLSLITFYKGFIDMLSGKTWNHMWYMYSLVGVLLIVPILKAIIDRLKKDEVIYICIVGFAFLSIIPLISYYGNFELGIKFPINSIYCIYMLLGYWMDSELIMIKEKLCKYMVAISFILIIVLSYINVVGHDVEILVSYTSPLILIYAIGLFGYIINNKNKITKMSKISICLAQNSFGVYIIHMFWINLIYKFIKVNPFEGNALINFVIIYVLVLGLSVILSMIMKKVPIIKAII